MLSQMIFKESMQLGEKRQWLKAQETAGYIDSNGRVGSGSGIQWREVGECDGMHMQ